MRHLIKINKHLHYLHTLGLVIILLWAFLTGIDYRAKTEIYEAHLSNLASMSFVELGNIVVKRS